MVAGRTDDRAAANSGTRGDATNDSSQVAAATPNTQGTSRDDSTSSNTNTSNPARGTAPTRGPPGANTIVAGSAHAIETDSPTLASNTTGPQPSTAAIIASGDRSQTARNGANASGRTSTPRNAAELRGALPSNLRNVPIVADPSLQGSSVQVHYTHDSHGVVTGVEIRVGPNAQARHITDHVNTVRAMQRLQGLSGRVRILLAQIGAWIAGRPDIRPGSLAWETRREIEKLSAIIDARAQALGNTSLTESQRAELEQELEAYADQLAYHQAAITDITNEPGRGYVAANGPNTSVLQQHFAAVRRQLANGNVTQRTEARGEHNAAMHMLRESRDPNSPWYGFEMARGFEAGHGFDQVWVRRENGQIVEIVIVEAKGRNLRNARPARLGSTVSMGPQMSRTWVLGTVFQEMHGTPADIELGDLIADAMQYGPPPAVYGVVVTGAHVWSGQSTVGNRAHPGRAYPSSLQPPPNVPVDPSRNAGVYHNTTPQRRAATPTRGPAPTRGPPATSATPTAATTPQIVAALRAALPANQRHIPIVQDPSLQGSTVRVHYTHNDRGVITGIEIRVGADAQQRHIADHANTVRTMQRYQGLSGRVRAALSRIGAWIRGNPNNGPGSLAWETQREVEKLNAIIAARTAVLDSGNLTSAERAEFEGEVASYEQQLAEHEAALDHLTNEPGRGYVAAEDTAPVSAEVLAALSSDADRARAQRDLARLPELSPDEVLSLLDMLAGPANLQRIANNQTIRNVVANRPTVLASLLRHPTAVDMIERAVRDARAPNPPTPVPGAELTTPLTAAQRALSERITARVPPGGRIQPEPFDMDRRHDASYREGYMNRLYAKAAAAQKKLTNLAMKIAKATRGEPKSRPEPKPQKRAWDKVSEGYHGNIARLTDLAGSSVIYDTLDDLYQGLESAVAEFGDRLVFFEDRFITPMASGYRDIQMGVMIDGHVSEFRLHLRDIEDVARPEHAAFEVRRAVGPVAEELGHPLTAAEKALVNAMKAEAQNAFDAALGRALGSHD